MSALIGALRVTLSAETAQFESGMRRAQRTTATAATGMQKSLGLVSSGLRGLVAGLSLGLLVNAARRALEYAGSLAEVAQQLGVTSRDLQVFRFAAGQVGVSQEQLETGLSKLTITLGKVAAGAKAPAQALAAIGVSADELKGKTTGEAFRIIADGLQKITDRSQRAAVEVALFGKSGAMLDNLLAGGSTAINELASAADKLGIVLSDEQIQRADDTADKLEALKTVLAAKVAGVVADNASAILGLADALASLVGSIDRAINGWRGFVAELRAGAQFLPLLAMGPAGFIAGAPLYDKSANKGRAQFDGANAGSRAGFMAGTAFAPAKPRPTTNIPQFLAGGGGGKGGRPDHSAEDALRDQFRFDQEMQRAQLDILRAQQDLANDYVERTSIGIQILNAEKDAYDAELRYEVAINDLTKGKEGLTQAQADQLRAANDQRDALERQKLLEEEQAEKREDINNLVQLDFDLEKDRLQSHLQAARTAKEQRDIQLRLLDLSYRQEKARLEAIIADEKSTDLAKEEARRRLQNLSHTYAGDRSAVLQNTQGPLEEFFSSVPRNAAEAQEAMERLQVMGIDGAINSIIALSEGFQSFRDTALSAIKQVIAELLRMQLMKFALSLFGAPASGGLSSGMGLSTGAGFGGLQGFATGGAGVFGGIGGVDQNILSLNGIPMARVSKGEPWAIGPGIRGGTTINIQVSGNPTRETMNQIAARTRDAVAAANRAGM